MKNLIVFVFCIVSLSAATTVDFQRFVLVPDATADRAAIIGSDNTVTNAATTTTQLNYLSSASGTSGSGNLIFGTSPTLTTPTIGSFANANHNHQDSAGGGQLSATSVFSSGTIPTARLGSGTANTTTFLRGDQSYAQPVENSLNLSDNTTNNASTSKHGFLLKLDNNAAHYMDGTGAWSTPSGSGANWVASGSTNSTLPGIGSAYQLIGTNGILSGDGSSPGGVVFSGGDVTLTNNATNAFSFIGASAGYTFDAPVSIGTGNALTAGTIELGNASDTTISRPAAGDIAIEGINVLKNSQRQLTTNPGGADDTWAGISFSGLNNSGGVTQWDAVYLNSSSQWVLADANGSGTYPCRGLAVATVATGNATMVIEDGVVRNDAWTWTPGGTIYLSTTAGGLTQTAPSTTGDKVQVIGYAIDADTMRVKISPDYGTAP